MIKSIQNDQKNSSKDQNQENGEIRDFFQSGFMKNEKSRLRAFARTRAKNNVFFSIITFQELSEDGDSHFVEVAHEASEILCSS